MRVGGYNSKYSTYGVKPIMSKEKMGDLPKDNKEKGNSDDSSKQRKYKEESFEEIFKSRIDIRV